MEWKTAKTVRKAVQISPHVKRLQTGVVGACKKNATDHPMVVVERRASKTNHNCTDCSARKESWAYCSEERKKEERLFTFPTKTKQTAVQSGKIFSLILFLFCRNLIKYIHQFNSSDNVTNLFDPLILIFC